MSYLICITGMSRFNVNDSIECPHQLLNYYTFFSITILILIYYPLTFQEAEVAEPSQEKWEIWLQHLQTVHRLVSLSI